MPAKLADFANEKGELPPTNVRHRTEEPHSMKGNAMNIDVLALIQRDEDEETLAIRELTGLDQVISLHRQLVELAENPPKRRQLPVFEVALAGEDDQQRPEGLYLEEDDERLALTSSLTSPPGRKGFLAAADSTDRLFALLAQAVKKDIAESRSTASTVVRAIITGLRRCSHGARPIEAMEVANAWLDHMWMLNQRADDRHDATKFSRRRPPGRTRARGGLTSRLPLRPARCTRRGIAITVRSA
ncbi:hypothetical protein [Amycolatopsis anabasis]|uniref:hypothetical protein n=1 Tax=Amycolatopsis anabasis TaxID=1840409 RepID=UPI00131BEF4F|nr:hypothetical protein [Amycolatopsis anabasis]